MRKKRWWHKSKHHTALFSVLAAVGIFFASLIALYVAEAIWPVLPQVDTPARLVVPSISVDAVIEFVGVTKEGRMDMPTNFTDVGWYVSGPRPGQAGTAVVAGHFDTNRDQNAVFAKLSLLKVGSDIYVKDGSGQKIRFRVTAKEVYDDAKAPLEKIFNQKGFTSRLNLVTCGGTWDEKTQNYSKRLVVYSEWVPS